MSGVKGGGGSLDDGFKLFASTVVSGGDVKNFDGSGTFKMTSERSRFVSGFSLTSIFDPCIRTFELGLSMCIPTGCCSVLVGVVGLLTGDFISCFLGCFSFNTLTTVGGFRSLLRVCLTTDMPFMDDEDGDLFVLMLLLGKCMMVFFPGDAGLVVGLFVELGMCI